VDVGFEARVGDRVTWFGALSRDTSLSGTDIDAREAHFGLRVRW
jgi:hypothetical protein